ncbi:MAG: hypothetical protein AMXMBFR61_19200 [Fimbriimonadales bacterium]
MKRTLSYLFGVVLMAGLYIPANAQNFPDVPEYHWAYEALETLKNDGLLVGYPDGMFRGARPMSRYEFAVAMNAAYQKLKYMFDGLQSRIDGLQRQIDALPKGGGGTQGDFASKADLQALRDQLEAFKNDLSGMKNWKNDIDALRKLMNSFEQDLASLGVDVEAMKKDLRSIEDRVAALEARKPAVDIHGTVDIGGRAGHSRDSEIGVDWNGAWVGANASGDPVGVTRDLHVMHELGLIFSGTYGRDVNMLAELVVGNLLPFEGGNMTTQFAGAGRKEEGNTDVWLHRFEAAWASSWFGAPVNLRLGRIGHQINPYILKRQDVDYYWDSDRWDNGDWMIDGGSVSFDWSSFSLGFYGGKVSNRGSALNNGVYDMWVGNTSLVSEQGSRPGNYTTGLMVADTILGAEVGVNLGRFGTARATYNLLDGPDTLSPASAVLPAFTFNRLQLWGGELDVEFAKNFRLNGYFAKSDYFYNDDSQLDEDNWLWDAALRYAGDRFNVYAGYREIGPWYGGPGSWGRIGYWNNPTDIKGFHAGVDFKVNDDISLFATGEFYTGSDRADFGGTVFGISEDDKINRIQAGIGFKFAENWHLGLGWEGVFWDLDEARLDLDNGKIDEHWYTADLTYDLGENTTWRFGYQILDYKNKTGDSFFNTPGNPNVNAKSGLFFTQFSIKF